MAEAVQIGFKVARFAVGAPVEEAVFLGELAIEQEPGAGLDIVDVRHALASASAARSALAARWTICSSRAKIAAIAPATMASLSGSGAPALRAKPSTTAVETPSTCSQAAKSSAM